MLKKHQEKKFPAQLDQLSEIRKMLTEFLPTKTMQDEEFSIENLIYAVDEACANIINHGYADSPILGQLTITLDEYEDHYEVQITDDAPRFNPLNAQLPSLDEHAKNHETHGLGIYMIRKLTDETNYQIQGMAKGNKLSLIQYKCAECVAG